MKNFKSRQLKSALVILFAVLIFSVSIPDFAGIRVCAEGDSDVAVIYEDNTAIESDGDDDDGEEDDEEGDDQSDDQGDSSDDGSEDSGDSDGNSDQLSGESTVIYDNSDEAIADMIRAMEEDEEDDEDILKKEKNKHKGYKKCSCVISKKKNTYYNKLSVGDELKLSVKLKGRKISSKKLSISCNKKSVVSISKDGIITAKKSGTAKIKVKNLSNKKEKCTIIVTVQRKK